MGRCRLQVYYSGRVQGVGFRYAVQQQAAGFEVVGAVHNLPDGRVELVAEGERSELEAFCTAIRDAGLARLIQHEATTWADARGQFRGFAIVS